MPLPYVKALTREIKEIKQVILKTQDQMQKRMEENHKIYEPTENLFRSVQNTRKLFDMCSNKVLNIIDEEKGELTKYKQQNMESLKELEKSAEFLTKMKEADNDSPVLMAVRAIAVMFPFIAFGLFNVGSKAIKS